MDKTNFSLRRITLLVIFVMLLISSFLSFSYAYYASTAVNNNEVIKTNTIVECLSITTSTSAYPLNTSLPSYFSPMNDNDARTQCGHNAVGTLLDYTGRQFGQERITIKNNCNKAVSIDILFMTDSNNQITLEMVRYALCTTNVNGGGYGSCACPGPNDYGTAYTLGYSTSVTGGANAKCYTSSTNSFWYYMASTGIGGAASTNMCSFVRQTNPTGISIAANGTTSLAIRYWLRNDTSFWATFGSVGWKFSGKFVVYSVND